MESLQTPEAEVDIYINEFGHTLTNSETSSHFIFTAIVIKRKYRAKAEHLRDKISRDFFAGQSIQTQLPTENLVTILQKLQKLDYLTFALVIDKSKIHHTGLSYKEVFYKYFNKVFLREFNNLYNSFCIHANPIEDEDFRRDLKQYIYEHAIQKNLFYQDRFYHLVENKQDAPLIELADFVAGCLGKLYTTSHATEDSHQLFEELHHQLFIDFYPYEKRYLEGKVPLVKQQRQSNMQKMSLDICYDFLRGPDAQKVSKEAIEILRYLMLMLKSFPEKLIEKQDLINKITLINPRYTENHLRHDIQSLRDNRILIASIKGKSGYKLPSSENDMVGFFNRYLDSIVPMLKRIRIANDVVAKRTHGNTDLLTEQYNLEMLDKLIDVVKQNHFN